MERVWIDQPEWRVLQPDEIVMDGDRPLVVGVEFAGDVVPGPIEAVLSRGMPAETRFEWTSARRVVAHVPPGGPFSIDLTGSEPAPSSYMNGVRFRVDRPTYELSYLRPADVAAGRVAPTLSFVLRLAVQDIPVAFAPGGGRALLAHGLGPRGEQGYRIVDLATGADLAAPFPEITRHGFSHMDWLADGRLLIVGTARTLVGDTLGSGARELRSLEGQGAMPSPARDRILLWSYAARQAFVLDPSSGSSVEIAHDFADGHCPGGLAWLDDARIAFSGCTSMDGPMRIWTYDARTGALVAERQGPRIVAALAHGARLVDPQLRAHRAHAPWPPLTLVDAAGREVAIVDPTALFLPGPSPDRRFLAYTDTTEEELRAILIDVGGRHHIVPGVRAIGWTKEGELAVLRRL